MIKCSHFAIQELVPPHIYRKRGEKAWQLLDDRLLLTLERLRTKYGPMTINTWANGGDRQWSGLRTPGSPYYSETSQHSFGRAADCLFRDHSAEDVRQDILESPNSEMFRLINSLELGVSWLHIDVRNCDRILAFKP